MKAHAQSVLRASAHSVPLLACLCLILAGLVTYSAAQAGKRLILKDGAWQGITQYELRGDRVRYFSSQRSEWEELPKELVDWKATEAWNAGLKKESPDLRRFEAEEEADREAEAAGKLTVEPGLSFPAVAGVFLFDKFSGQPLLDELTQNGSELNNEAGHSILSSPVNRRATISQRFELKGPRARVQAHVTTPEIFVNITGEPLKQQPGITDRFRIVRLESNEHSRVLTRVQVSVTGKQSQSPQFVATRAENFGEGWLKVIPLSGLELGEYALVEMLGQNDFNSFVWDFGVDPNAAANPNPLKPINERTPGPE